MSDFELFFVEVVVSELLLQIVLEGLLIGDGGLIGVVVAAVVVGLQPVRIIISVFFREVVAYVKLIIFAEVDFVIVVVIVLAIVIGRFFNGWLVVVIVVLVAVFKGGVDFHLLLDALFEFD